jgi:hypothetical protein
MEVASREVTEVVVHNDLAYGKEAITRDIGVDFPTSHCRKGCIGDGSHMAKCMRNDTVM